MHDDLTPRERLELLRREEAEEHRATNDRMNAWLRDVTGKVKPLDPPKAPDQHQRMVTREQDEAKIAELRADDPTANVGYDTLAKALHVSPTTIRRALGATK